MINFNSQVPSVYPNVSRDFQYLSWLINIVLNSVKHNIDAIYDLPNTKSNPKLTELLAMTLGFKIKRSYDEKQLTALAAILPSLLKYKGTKKAIRMAADALVTAAGALGEPSVEIEGTEVKVTLPKDLVDIALFIDLLDYILPAGMTCHVVRRNAKVETVKVDIKQTDTVNLMLTDDYKFNKNAGTITGLATLYEADGVPEFSANIKEVSDEPIVNTGLLSNTVIPVLSGKEIVNEDIIVLYSTEADGTHKRLEAQETVLTVRDIDA